MPDPRTGAAVLVALALLSGCASLEQAEPPGVTLVDLRIADVTVFETSLEATVRVTNPNPEPLEVEGASFKLRLNGHKVGTGTAPAATTVPALESVTVEARFHLSNLAALRRLQELLESEAVEYGLESRLFVRRPWGRSTLRAATTGRIDLAGGTPAGPGPAVTAPRS